MHQHHHHRTAELEGTLWIIKSKSCQEGTVGNWTPNFWLHTQVPKLLSYSPTSGCATKLQRPETSLWTIYQENHKAFLPSLYLPLLWQLEESFTQQILQYSGPISCFINGLWLIFVFASSGAECLWKSGFSITQRRNAVHSHLFQLAYHTCISDIPHVKIHENHWTIALIFTIQH